MTPKAIYDYIDELYTHNAFVQLCGIKTHNISCGQAAVGLRLDKAKHTNLNNSTHGGLIMTIMDNATGIAAATIGKKVVTVSMTAAFIKSAPVGALIEAKAEIAHQDGNILTMNIQVYDHSNDNLLASGISSMLIITDFPDIPEKWEGSYQAPLAYLNE
ncbi:PaaI family thioesterase [uncultured Phascolarctobacterium sp.]|uniref:PaaI family thioesterase n=1 Tax=uncultured Phascolarctobacterium sp. TaxID=512296 RepID=UPI00260797ED|nr:PaaI family thioesterase [uncultured Phascolarctobacterium sp.]